MEMRADMYLDLAPLDLSMKPRLRLHWETWEAEDQSDGSEWDSEVYINEWLARVGLHNTVFVPVSSQRIFIM